MRFSFLKGFNAFIFCLVVASASAQVETVIPPSNRSTTSMEKNMLFHATKRFSVSQSGSTSLPLENLFDGNFSPNYSSPINPADPYVLLVQNLPNRHSQTGAWVGWTTRYYNPVRFKIEAYNIHDGANTWVTIADVQNYSGGSYIVQLSELAAGKLRFTFYEGTGPSGAIGLSELFYIHTEAAVAYDGLMVQYSAEGNVGIGVTNPTEKLAVNGNIRAKEIKVETANWPDYVFAPDYQNTTLSELEKYIKAHQHLPDMPSAKEVEANGVSLGEMDKALLKNQEELTLHLIEQGKLIQKLQQELKQQQIIIDQVHKNKLK